MDMQLTLVSLHVGKKADSASMTAVLPACDFATVGFVTLSSICVLSSCRYTISALRGGGGNVAREWARHRIAGAGDDDKVCILFA